jgi:hypothetical protein
MGWSTTTVVDRDGKARFVANQRGEPTHLMAD